MMRRDPHPSSTAEKSRFSMMEVTAIHQRRANAVARLGAMVEGRERERGSGEGNVERGKKRFIDLMGHIAGDLMNNNPCINIHSCRRPPVSAGPTPPPRGRGPAPAAASSRSRRLLELQQEICEEEEEEVRDTEGRGKKMKRFTARRSYLMETQPPDNLQAAAVSLNSSFRDVNGVKGDLIFTYRPGSTTAINVILIKIKLECISSS
ncbi:hypothetical protein EYF80_038646 [Liparis tanakae]|uniref:Uncharacterized protein n=1 Tax=Liparis tanakae TaxID=230148 RepID=A0A4Z2GC70_9TELE|nr:hypothetical protein EYF80_038646 [Liparis tanakae]